MKFTPKQKPRLKTASYLIAGLLTIGAFGQFACATDQYAAPAIDTSLTPGDLFNKAIADDLNGNVLLARQEYDALKNTPMAADSAVPSAVNLVALKRFDDAKNAFAAIADGSNKQDAGYARLWNLWLVAQKDTQSEKERNTQLVKTAKSYNADTSWRQAIINLYSGKGSVEKVFSAVDSDKTLSPSQRSDALAEATFFSGSYLRYVAKDKNAARALYIQKTGQLNTRSLENYFINQEMAAL